MSGTPEQSPLSEGEVTRRVVTFDQSFQAFAPGEVAEITDWEGNHGYEAVVTLTPGDQPLFKDMPPLPFHFVLLEGELARQHQAGLRATSALTPLGTQGYQITPEDYDPQQRMRKFTEWQKRGNISYDQAALWLHTVIPDEELRRLGLTRDASKSMTPLLPGLSFALRQLELTLDSGTGEPLAARPDMTALQVGQIDIHSFYPKKTGPLAVPAMHYGVRSMSTDNPVSWLTEGLGVYLPKERTAYEHAQFSFNVVSEQRVNAPKRRS